MANTNGSEAALNIAFQDLKRRYLAQRNELNFLRQQSTLNGTNQNNPTTNIVLEKKIEQLCKMLETKTSAYKSLENMYFQTRENEEYLLKHTQQIEELLVKALEKSENCQKQNSQLKQDQESLVLSFYQIEKGREKANESQELCTPTFSHTDSSETLSMEMNSVLSTNNNEDLNSLSTVHLPKWQKQIDCLLSEKKALQTKIIWLTEELRVEKEKNENLKDFKNDTKTRGISEGDSAPKIMFRSIKVLHEKINLLQNMLKRNSEIINKLTSKFTKTKHDVEEPVIFLKSHHNFDLPPLEQVNPVFLQNFYSGDSTNKDPFYKAEHSDNCLDESKQTSLLQYFKLTFPVEKDFEKSV